MEQTERHKPKYSKTYSPSWPTGYQIHSRDTPDSCCKYVPRNTLTVPANRANRRHASPAMEPVSGYYANSYRPQKYHACVSSTHPKYATAMIQNPDLPHRYPQIASRSSKERSLNGNVAVIRNNRYKEDVDEENTKYIDDELGNFTEDNADEDIGEEVEDEQEEAEETEREYEEGEAEDDIDEDAEISPQLQRVQRRVKKEAFLRAQRMRDAEQQQDLRRIRYQQQANKLYDDHANPKRYYRTTDEADAPEVVSDEEATEPPFPGKNGPRRSSARQQTSHTWSQPRHSQRSETEREGNVQPIRRIRGKSEVDHLPESRQEMIAAKKCSRCGGSSADRKNLSTRKAICRLQEPRDFPGKGPIGEEIETNVSPVCVRCNLRHNPEKMGDSCEFPRSGIYSLAPRRSRDSRSARISAYENQEIRRPVDETTEEYRSRNSRENPNLFRQKTRHSIQPSRDRTATPSDYRI